MPLTAPIYLVDSPSGQQWQLVVDNSATPGANPVSGQSAVPFVYVNSVTDGTSWQISIVGNPPPSGLSWGDIHTVNVPQGNYPTQLLVTAPNGTVYGIQVATIGPPLLGSAQNGVIQSTLPTSSLDCSTPISTLAANVLQRLEENYSSGVDSPGPIFWNQSFEIYTAIVEAMNDLMLLVGRPTQTVNTPFNLVPNSVWQKVPKGGFLITDIQGSQGTRIRKGTLFDLDYSQSSWGSDWENDIDPAGPRLWVPIGMTMFVVYPAPSAPQTVMLDGIAYPVAETNFPYTGAETVPFHHEFMQYLEMYGAHYNRIKESTSEFQESLLLYKGYLEGAKRLTEIEDRRDKMIFSPSFGGPAGVQSHVKR